VRISVYFGHAGSPPIASPTPTTAPVTVKAVAIGYPANTPIATSAAAVSSATMAAPAGGEGDAADQLGSHRLCHVRAP